MVLSQEIPSDEEKCHNHREGLEEVCTKDTLLEDEERLPAPAGRSAWKGAHLPVSVYAQETSAIPGKLRLSHDLMLVSTVCKKEYGINVCVNFVGFFSQATRSFP